MAIKAQYQEEFQAELKKLATKEDLKNFSTKKDLEKFATKEDLQQSKEYLETLIRRNETEIKKLK